MHSVVKRLKLKSIAAITVVLIAASGLLAQTPTPQPWSSEVSPLPAPTGPVNDYAGVIDEQAKAALNKRLIDFQRSTGVEMAVAVVRTTGERPIFDYSLAVARGWGIGAKADDNPSLLLLVAIDDRKYFTQVSSNLEDELPDGLVGSIQRQNLVPEFRKGNYAKGIADTIESYIRTYEERSSGTAASPTPVAGRERSRGGSQGLYSAFCCVVVIGVVLLIIFSNRGGRGGKGGGWLRRRWLWRSRRRFALDHRFSDRECREFVIVVERLGLERRQRLGRLGWRKRLGWIWRRRRFRRRRCGGRLVNLSLVICHWSLVIALRSSVFGLRSLVFGLWTGTKGQRTNDK